MIKQTGYHHANMLAEQLPPAIIGQGAEMLAMLQEIAAGNPAKESPAYDPPYSRNELRSTTRYPALNIGDSAGYAGK